MLYYNMNIFNKHIKFFNRAKEESFKTDFRARVGAVIVKNKRIISVGRNKPKKTHPEIKKYNLHKTIHAEIDAIIGIRRDILRGSDIYVYRELKNGMLANSKPCELCQNFLREYGIKKVYYTIDNNNYGEELI